MFGKLFTLIGLVMIGAGIFGIVRSSQSLMGLNLGNTMQLATDTKAREAQLCKPGEKLVEEKGPSTYTAGRGYSSSVTMYCVNNENQKRDVTGDFANGLVGQVGGIFDNVFTGLFGSVIYVGLVGIGLVLAIIGLLVGRRRSIPVVTVGAPSSYGASTFTVQNTSGSANLNQIIQQARQMKASASTDLSTRLKQLEDARNAGLISQTEYDRARQQIIDSMK